MYFFEEGQWEKNRPFLISDQEGTVTYGDLDSFTEIMGKKLKKGNWCFYCAEIRRDLLWDIFASNKRGSCPFIGRRNRV